MKSPHTFMVTSVACVALGLSSCGSLPQVYPGLPTASSTSIDEKALYVAEAAYQGLGTIAEAAVDSGFLTGTRAGQVRDLNRQAYQALTLARTAYATANVADYLRQTTRVLDLIAQAQSIIRSST